MINRFSDSVGERAIARCNRLRLDLWKEDGGNVVASFELHGSIGDFESDDDNEGGVKDQADLSLLRDLLDRFQQIGGGE